MYLVYPVVEEVHVLNTKTHTIELPELDANTNDRQTVQTQVSFNVQYDTAQAPAIYRQYRTTENFDKQIVIPRLVYAVKTITARYSAPDQIRLRPNVDADMIKFANDQLANTGASVTANGLQIGNFRYAADYQKAIEDTQVAQQNLIKSQNELKVAQIDARTRIAAAQGEAQSARLTAAANNATSLQSKFLDKWDGHLPTVMGNSGGNLLDVKTLMGSTH
jgi:regulator of protease activity HflC (stomatin/prohibitin superfamily)